MPYIDTNGKVHQVLVTYTKMIKGEEVILPPSKPPCPNCGGIRHKLCCKICKRTLSATQKKFLGGIFCSRKCSAKYKPRKGDNIYEKVLCT